MEEEGRNKIGAWCCRFIRFSAFFILHSPWVSQFHHVIEIAFLIVASNLEHIDQTGVRTGDRLEFANAGVLALKRALVVEIASIYHFDGAMRAQGGAREPNFTVAAATDGAQPLVIGHAWRGTVR